MINPHNDYFFMQPRPMVFNNRFDALKYDIDRNHYIDAVYQSSRKINKLVYEKKSIVKLSGFNAEKDVCSEFSDIEKYKQIEYDMVAYSLSISCVPTNKHDPNRYTMCDTYLQDRDKPQKNVKCFEKISKFDERTILGECYINYVNVLVCKPPISAEYYSV